MTHKTKLAPTEFNCTTSIHSRKSWSEAVPRIQATNWNTEKHLGSSELRIQSNLICGNQTVEECSLIIFNYEIPTSTIETNVVKVDTCSPLDRLFTWIGVYTPVTRWFGWKDFPKNSKVPLYWYWYFLAVGPCFAGVYFCMCIAVTF